MPLRWQKFAAWILLLVCIYGFVGFAIRERQFEATLVASQPMMSAPRTGEVLLETKSGPFSVPPEDARHYWRDTYVSIFFVIGIVGAIAWLRLLHKKGKVKE